MVFRAKKNKNYTVVNNYYIRDKTISSQARGLLTQMLSLPDNWHYTVRGLTAIAPETYNTVRGMVKELEQAGYVVRRQVRKTSGKWSGIEYDIYEIPLSVAYEMGAEWNLPKSADAEPETPEAVPEAPPPPMSDEATTPDAVELNEYRREIRENIAFDLLWRDYGVRIERLMGYVEMMADVCAGKERIRVNGHEIPADEARRRLLSLDMNHILYVMECMDNTRGEIRNIRAYTLAALYNAPGTIDQYYRTKVRRDEAEDEDE